MNAARDGDGGLGGLNPRSPNRLLIVDDEPQICRSLRRILRSDGYEIFTAGSGSEAFGILADEPIDVILSDQRMPHMKGTEFLNEVMLRYPGTVRLILSGAADLEDITSAMTAGAIYKFLTKPIEPSLLRANVSEAFSRAKALAASTPGADQWDTETGLYTREHVEGTFGPFAADASAAGNAVCLMLIQVDQYTNIVASFGYAFGEQFICTVAQTLRLEDEPDCYICRDSASSFLVLTADASPEQRLARLRSRLDYVFSEPVLVSDHRITVTLSVGGTSSRDPNASLGELVDQANTAMMTASIRGGATMQLYQEDLVSVWRDRVQLESDLREAVTQRAFELHYQPQVDVSTGRIVGLEALLRWPHPQLGFVSPGEFVPVAERLGLIKQLGAWVLERAVTDFVEWDAAHVAPRELAVNVSAYQMKNLALVAQIEELLAQTGLEPSRLVLEVTETAAIEQEAAIAERLEGLRALGVTIAIDDFGTGYANLSLLSKLEIRKLKIDRSLLPVGTESRSVKLFTNVVSMASELGLELVAEGVETPVELAAVYGAGCRVVQGYFYSPPVNTERLGVLLRNQFADGRHNTAGC